MFLAKIASDLHKPDGLTVIRPEDAHDILMELPIGKFYGVGRVTEKLFFDRGIKTGADLIRMTREELTASFGKSGDYYYEVVRGNDEREVTPEREHKSLGTECTFAHDTTDLTELVSTLAQQSAEIESELRKEQLAGKTITLKLKYFDFRTITRSRSLDFHTDDAEIISEAARLLLLKTDASTVPVRLIGVTVSHFHDPVPEEKNTGEVFQPEFDFGEEL